MAANDTANLYWDTTSGGQEDANRLRALCDRALPPGALTRYAQARWERDRTLALDHLARATNLSLELGIPYDIASSSYDPDEVLPVADLVDRLSHLHAMRALNSVYVRQAGRALWHALVINLPPHLAHLTVVSVGEPSLAPALDFGPSLYALPVGLRSLYLNTPGHFTAADWSHLLFNLPGDLRTLFVCEEFAGPLQTLAPVPVPWPCPARHLETLVLDQKPRSSRQGWQLSYLLGAQQRLRELFLYAPADWRNADASRALEEINVTHLRWATVATAPVDPLPWLARLWHTCETLRVYGGRLSRDAMARLDVGQARRLRSVRLSDTFLQRTGLPTLGRAMPDGLHHLSFSRVYLADDYYFYGFPVAPEGLTPERLADNIDLRSGGLRAQQLKEGDFWSLV